MKLTKDEFSEHRDSYDGYCINCDCIGRWGMTEPDARDYKCEECGKNTCIGMEEAIFDSKIELIFE